MGAGQERAVGQRSAASGCLLADDRGLLLAAMVAITLLFTAQSAGAATWVFDPTLRVLLGADDNLDLQQQGAEDNYRTSVKVGVTAQKATRISRVLVAGSVGYTRYDGQEEAADDSGDFQSLEVDADYRLERTRWGVNGRFLRDNTVVDVVLLDDDIDPGADIDADPLQKDVRRNRAIISPYLTQTLTQRATLGASYTGTFLRYDESGADQRESLNHELELRTDYRLTERTEVGVGVQGGFFRRRDAVNDIDTLGLVLNLQHRLSEVSLIQLSGGARRSELSNEEGDTTGYTGRLLGLTGGETWQTRALVERRLRPSGRGVLTETDQVIVRGSRDLSPRLSATFTGRAFKSRILGDQPDAGATDTFVSLLPGLAYKLTQEWSLSGEYQYRSISRIQIPGKASGNAVFLTLEYSPRREINGF